MLRSDGLPFVSCKSGDLIQVYFGTLMCGSGSGTTGSLPFDPKVKQYCSKLMNPFERHPLPFLLKTQALLVVLLQTTDGGRVMALGGRFYT